MSIFNVDPDFLKEETKLREDLAMSKLRILTFSALAEPMKASFEDLLNRSSVSLYRWEDIITDANSVIKKLVWNLGIRSVMR